MPRSNTTRPAAESPSGSAWLGGLIFVVRYVLPAAIVLAGAIIMAHGSEVDLEGGAEIVSAGLSVYLANWLFRIGYSSHEREDEEAGAGLSQSSRPLARSAAAAVSSRCELQPCLSESMTSSSFEPFDAVSRACAVGEREPIRRADVQRSMPCRVRPRSSRWGSALDPHAAERRTSRSARPRRRRAPAQRRPISAHAGV